MKYVVLTILVTIVILSKAEVKLPKYIIPCKAKDSLCLKNLLKGLAPRLKLGIREFNLPTIDPVELPDYNVSDYTSSKMPYAGFVKSLQYRGASNFEVSKFDIDLDELTFNLVVFFPQLIMRSYEIVWVKAFDIESNGEGFVTEYYNVSGLRDMNIKVPEAVRVGETVTLTCDYDLEQVALYTIKWYRHDLEFYRYVPKESPPSKVFPMEHITVDISKSNSRDVTLTKVDRETSGEFKCEVSADAPLFHTEIRAANLLVADFNDDGPVLRTDPQKVVTLGGKIKANCTTPGSFPPMNVTWFINDAEVHPRSGVKIQESVERYEALPGLESVRSTLTIKAIQDLFKNGKIKLTCLARVYNLYNHTKEIELQEDSPLLALVMVVPTTHSNEGINNGNRATSIFSIHVFAVACSLWLKASDVFH